MRKPKLIIFVNFFTMLIILFILSSCSKERVEEDEDLMGDLENNLAWHSGTAYETEIIIGETITWTWGGGTHNLKSTGGVEDFDSGYSSLYGFTFSYIFNNLGTTTYVCDPYESHMYGSVTVIE